MVDWRYVVPGGNVDRAVNAGLPRALDVLSRLISHPSIRGFEAGAQEELAQELAGTGFEVSRLEIPDSTADLPTSGVASGSYRDRYDVIGVRTAGSGPSLLLNGHIDVVPASTPELWTSAPFVAAERDGWLYGRGAGDMKAGFVAGLLAFWALDEVAPEWLCGRLTFVSAIEEECTGNGTLAACVAGYTADAALLLEPTDLQLLLGGIALTWVTVEITGYGGHAEAARRSVNPVSATGRVIDAMADFEAALNFGHRAEPDPAFEAFEAPYAVNVGVVRAGDWPSSVPSVMVLDIRVGHPGSWSSQDALEEVGRRVTASLAGDPWYAENPPQVRLTGYRAERHVLDRDAPLANRLARAHESAHGRSPQRVTIGSTTDARYYLNNLGIPALAYGPRTRDIHGVDEGVEIASIAACAQTLARFLLDWFAPGSPS